LAWWFFSYGGMQDNYCQIPPNDQMDEGCTIGVASGNATTDGRPLVWKTRDNSSEPDNEIAFNSSCPIKFIAVINANETYAWMGVNEKGFAIVNSVTDDLNAGNSGPSNGQLMRDALGNCSTVADFEALLISTNTTGRQTRANFAVIDSTGAAAIFETAGYEFWKFDAHDSIIAPEGYILRTNFAFNGAAKNGLHDNIYSIERFRRQQTLIDQFHRGDSLNHRSILRYQMRDFSDFDSQPLPVPYPQKWRYDRPFGYIYTGVSICRSSSVSASVIQGILPQESPRLSVLWTILGQPAAGIAVPYFPVGQTPAAANGTTTAPLCDISLQIRSLLFDYSANNHYIDSYKLRDDNAGGLWSKIFPAEDSIFTVSDSITTQWRSQTTISTDDILQTQQAVAQYALRKLSHAFEGMVTSISDPQTIAIGPSRFQLWQNYPNPFNASTSIPMTLSADCFGQLQIFDLLGKIILSQNFHCSQTGYKEILFQPDNLASGVYLYRIRLFSDADYRRVIFSKTKKLHYLK
ncbi:MAG TPA: T9SS type A sorting domain-containing protein, partial [bacterium]|nr:T9SS type A sorting domain-containing protein [bacterium]